MTVDNLIGKIQPTMISSLLTVARQADNLLGQTRDPYSRPWVHSKQMTVNIEAELGSCKVLPQTGTLKSIKFASLIACILTRNKNK